MPMNNEAAKVHLVTCLADALQSSISLKRGGQWFCAASTAAGSHESVGDSSGSLVLQIRLRGTLHGELRIEIAQDDAKALLEPDGSGLLREAWREIMEGLVQRLPKRAVDAGMFAFSVESCDLAEPLEDYAQIGKMELGQSDRKRCVLHVLADGELVESFQIAEWSVSQTTKSSPEQTVTRELGRVIDVPLTVTLRFGQRNMRLREVLELNTGALVELDRQAEDPVGSHLPDERVRRLPRRSGYRRCRKLWPGRVTEIVERPSTVVL